MGAFIIDDFKPKKKKKNGDYVLNRFSKKQFNKLMKDLANDPSFVAKIAVTKNGELDHIEDVAVSKGFRQWCKQLIEQVGVDSSESAIVLEESFQFKNMDGLYEFFSTALYQYMNAGNKYDLMPTEDFKASLYIKKNPKTKKSRKGRNPITGEDLGVIETTYEPYSSLKAQSPAPKYLTKKN